MSVIPPSSFILSKMKYYLKSKLDPELYQDVLNKTGPYPIFSLDCSIRYLDGKSMPVSYSEEDLKRILEVDSLIWDCADTAVFNYGKLKKRMKDEIPSTMCVIKLSLLSKVLGPSQQLWHSVMVDEYHQNVIFTQTQEGIDREYSEKLKKVDLGKQEINDEKVL